MRKDPLVTPASLRRTVLASVAALALAATPSLRAQLSVAAGAPLGGVLVTPVRLVLDDDARSAELTLVNRGSKREVVRVSFGHFAMDPAGSMSEVPADDPGTRWADELLRFSPHQVTLDPGQPQLVRLQIRRRPDLDPGEYRSHLVFQVVSSGDDATDVGAPAHGTAVRLRPRFGVSIPIFVRMRSRGVEVAIDDVHLVPATADAPESLHVELRREGDRSVYGDLRVERQRGSAPAETVTEIRGVAVYAPNSSRSFDLALPEGFVAHGDLVVRYLDRERDAGELASRRLALP
jgi:hypothetical protein